MSVIKSTCLIGSFQGLLGECRQDVMLSFGLFFFFSSVIINTATYYQIAHYSYYLWYPKRMSPSVSSLMKSEE